MITGSQIFTNFALFSFFKGMNRSGENQYFTLDAQGGASPRSHPLVPSIPPPVPPPCPYTDVAPLSTPQAIARGSGWGCFVGRVSSPPLLLPLVSSRRPLIVSPSSFHPPTTSRAVLVRLGVGGVSSRSPLPAPTREPPCEQMLVDVGQASWPSSSPPRFLTHPSTLRAGARSGVFPVPRRLPSLSSSLSIVVPPPTTPRAAAREAGGAWGVVCGGCGGGPPSQRCGVWVEGG
jgi:hypothetical protein